MGMQISAGGAKGKRPQPVPVMNVTPLVDIALVVLIIFMIIIPMSQKTFWLHFPKQEKEKPKTEEATDAEEEGPLVLTIDRKGTIRVNQAILRKSDIPARLPRMLAAQPLPILYFDAADNITYGQAVEVMDIAKLSGAKAIAVLTEKVVK